MALLISLTLVQPLAIKPATWSVLLLSTIVAMCGVRLDQATTIECVVRKQAMLLHGSSIHKDNGSSILAFDKSKPRKELLSNRMQQAGASNVCFANKSVVGVLVWIVHPLFVDIHLPRGWLGSGVTTGLLGSGSVGSQICSCVGSRCLNFCSTRQVSSTSERPSP